ncbi:hypothetical protein [Clostridium botulinum]|uniref:hypothetical protein n=1 Tax=Clostridium botulinum TaxID=1491 RepID=UPI003A80FA61
MEEDIKHKSSSNSVITLDLKIGDKLKFTYDSNIKEGELKFQLIRSKNYKE